MSGLGVILWYRPLYVCAFISGNFSLCSDNANNHTVAWNSLFSSKYVFPRFYLIHYISFVYRPFYSYSGIALNIKRNMSVGPDLGKSRFGQSFDSTIRLAVFKSQTVLVGCLGTP